MPSSAPRRGIATGAALRKKLANEASIAVAMSGDGSTGCGPVFEAMNFAAMAQYDTLWTDARKGGLPVLFFFTNNFYAMGGQTIGETMGWDRLSRIGAAVNHEALHAETVDGTNPLAVADAVARKRALLLAGQGPGAARRRMLPLHRPLHHRRQCLPHQGGNRRLGVPRPDPPDGAASWWPKASSTRRAWRLCARRSRI